MERSGFGNSLEGLAAEIVGCKKCPRLVEYREEVARRKRRAFRDQEYWGRPVPGYGDPEAHLVIVGLAPAAHGANRTGRMFTGDGPRGAGDTLMRALHRLRLANIPFSRDRDDGLSLRGVFLTAVVRCAPPGNRPTYTEISNCLPYLVRELRLLRGARAILALGRVAFEGCLRALGELGVEVPKPKPTFAHGACFRLGPYWLVASYHPSRQNTQTGRLSEEAFLEAVAAAKGLAGL